ncbi:MAG: hypothetical protein P8174_07385 [Gemmatimonadota bacterium]
MVDGPGGQALAVSGAVSFTVPDVAGIYTVRSGDSTLAAFAVNTPAAESDLARVDPAAVLGSLDLHRVNRARDWPRAVFVQRHGLGLTVPMLLVALALLIAESAVAASGRGARTATAGHAGATGGR